MMMMMMMMYLVLERKEEVPRGEVFGFLLMSFVELLFCGALTHSNHFLNTNQSINIDHIN